MNLWSWASCCPYSPKPHDLILAKDSAIRIPTGDAHSNNHRRGFWKLGTRPDWGSGWMTSLLKYLNSILQNMHLYWTILTNLSYRDIMIINYLKTIESYKQKSSEFSHVRNFEASLWLMCSSNACFFSTSSYRKYAFFSFLLHANFGKGINRVVTFIPDLRVTL